MHPEELVVKKFSNPLDLNNEHKDLVCKISQVQLVSLTFVSTIAANQQVLMVILHRGVTAGECMMAKLNASPVRLISRTQA